MAIKKIITVFGATGAQGGAVANTFLHDAKLNGQWAVRAVTRDVTKPSAAKLRDQGAQVVAADINTPATLLEAMSGATAVYAVTNYWESHSLAVEVTQGKSLVDAALATGVQHFIWSSLLDMAELTNNRLPHIHHFTSKALVEAYARTTALPCTFFLPGYYMSNIPGTQLRPDPSNGNIWTFSLPVAPATRIPLFNPADTGKFVASAVLNRDRMLGERVLGASEYLTCQGIVDGFKSVFPESGRGAVFKRLEEGEYVQGLLGKGMSPEAARETVENMLMLESPGYYAGEELGKTLELVREAGFGLTSWEEFVRGSERWGVELR